jgi:hypothetical protein
MRPPTTRPSLLCWRCRHRLLYPEEQAQHKLLRARFLRVTAEGQLWMQCATRGCGAWCVVPASLYAVVCATLGYLAETVGCAHD